MNRIRNSWAGALALFILAVVLTSLLGVSVGKITRSDTGSTEKKQTEEPSSEAPDTSESTGETEEPEKGIEILSDEDLQMIDAIFSDEVKTYIPGDVLDSENRPLGAVEAYSAMNSISGDIRIFNAARPAADDVSFTFILNEENGTKTLQMLDILKSAGVKALFLTTQDYVVKNGPVILQILSDGHEIGSRGTGTHSDSLVNYPLYEQMNDVLCFQNYMEKNYNYTMKWFNFSGDEYSERSLKLMTDLGYNVVFFSVDYPEYDPALEIDTGIFLQIMKNKLHDGAIYSFHTVHDATLAIMPEFLSWLRDSGITVSEIR